MLYTEPIAQKSKDENFPAMTKLLKKSHDFEEITVDGELWWLADYFKESGKTHVIVKVSFFFV